MKNFAAAAQHEAFNGGDLRPIDSEEALAALQMLGERGATRMFHPMDARF